MHLRSVTVACWLFSLILMRRVHRHGEDALFNEGNARARMPPLRKMMCAIVKSTLDAINQRTHTINQRTHKQCPSCRDARGSHPPELFTSAKSSSGSVAPSDATRYQSRRGRTARPERAHPLGYSARVYVCTTACAATRALCNAQGWCGESGAASCAKTKR